MMLKIIKNFGWRRQILVLGLCLTGFACYGVDYKFTRNCIVRNGGTLISTGDETTIGKYDLAVLCRSFYNTASFPGNTWGTIKGINPNIQLFLYQLGSEANDNTDPPFTFQSLYNLGRWKNPRIANGGPGTDIYDDNIDFLLVDTVNHQPINNTAYPDSWRMDVGLAAYQNYWLSCTVNDVVNQPWVADGIFLDNCCTLWWYQGKWSTKYPDNPSWVTAMNSFINATTLGLKNASPTQKAFCNRGSSNTVDGYNAYISLDGIVNPPYATLEESAFTLGAGSGCDVSFFAEADWKRQVDVLGAVHHYIIDDLATVSLADGANGTDNYGISINFYDVLWYDLCSYHLGKNDVDDNSYFTFCPYKNYSSLPWYDELNTAYLNLGRAVGPYQIKVISGRNIYMREFNNGYVYVNPTAADVNNIGLRETCKQLTHSNFKNDPSTITNVNTISLPARRGTILLKSAITTSGTVYEDAENGNTTGWNVYTGTGGTITNVFDAERDNRVISLYSANGRSTGYRKLTDSLTYWGNSTQLSLSWKMKYATNFIVYIQLDTSAGTKYLTYYAADGTPGEQGMYINYNLGSTMTDGRWHTVVRDLKADLNYYTSGRTINSVMCYMICGNGYVDDIELLNQNSIYEDAENGDTAGWSIYDTQTTGTITNTTVSGHSGRVIHLHGDQTYTGFEKLNDAGANWSNTTQKTLSWSMKTAMGYNIYILVGTSAGSMYLEYTNVDSDALGTGQYVLHGLGSNTIDNNWHTYTRDLQKDLTEAQPGVTITSVNAFLMRTGDAYLDDIDLISQ